MVCALVLLATVPATAQDLRPTLSQFKHRSWTREDGAPGAVHAIAQTPDGFLWLGTSRGLYRFDGVTFEKAGVAAGSQLENIGVSHLIVGRDGTLWAGLFDGAGVAVLRGGQLHDMHMPDPPMMITDLVEGRDGSIWAVWGGLENRLARYVDGRWQKMDAVSHLPAGQIIGIVVDADGTLFVSLTARGGGGGVLAYLPRGAARFRRSPHRGLATASLARDCAGRLWAAGRTGTYPLDPYSDGNVSGAARYAAVPGLRVAAITFDRWGGIWGTTRTVGVFHVAAPWERSEVERFTAADGLSADSTRSLLVDREGTIWIGTGEGLDQFRRVPVVLEAGVEADIVHGNIMADGDGGTAYITSHGRLFAIDGSARPRMILSGFPSESVICPARTGGVWLGGQSSVRRVGPAGEVRGRWQSGNVYNCLEDRRGRLWLATGDGLQLLENGRLQSLDGAQTKGDVWDMALDPDYDLAFSLNQTGLVRVRGRAMTYLAPERLAVGPIGAMASDSRGLYVSGARGMLRIRGNRIDRIDSARAPWLAGARAVMRTADGETWILNDDGISVLSSAALDRGFDDPSSAIARRLYDSRDGLPGGPQHIGFRGGQLAAGSDGRRWFTTRAGLVRLDGLHAVDRTPPPVAIRMLSGGGVAVRDPQISVLPKGTRTVTIAYSALSLAVPERVRFRYRLEGIDEDWVDPGARREANYANLPPGTYRFNVIAASDAGVWNREGAVASFTIPPTFLESPTFHILLLLGAVALLWLAYSLRMQAVTARVRLRMTERLRERERISRDLHDTFLQSVQALILRFQLAADELPRGAASRGALENALDQADQVMAEGRERLHDLRASEKASAIEIALRELVERQHFDSRVESCVLTSGEPRPLHPLVATEAVNIAREALFNVWRHARGDRVEVLIGFDAHQFVVRVRDNGTGIDPDVLGAGGRAGHFGLAGMRERARGVGGELAIDAAPGSGTDVSFVVPATLAYRLAEAPRGRLWRCRRD
ncbi:sensor histidine kinase [Sphingosinithalassobacter portus]|uniref:sensor histidine kinase n=1 Tax=Stakelama portus TaxID=2676234 RepID=UPI000D6E4714|nr:sensor histidine kinase [Sphingosinithalassobacter portus]